MSSGSLGRRISATFWPDTGAADSSVFVIVVCLFVCLFVVFVAVIVALVFIAVVALLLL